MNFRSTRTWFFQWALTSALLLLGSACGDASTPARPDGGVQADAGTTPDAGALPDGGGVATRDTLELLAGNTATGFVDGTGTAARFSGPAGAVLTHDGAYVYVADTFNNLLRRIDTGTGEVVTLAGRVQQMGAVDGTATEARFKSPRALAHAPDGSALYLADGPTIRRVSLPDAQVTTLAGSPDSPGNVDGVGDEARLGSLLHSLAISEDGATLYIADRTNRVLRTLDLASRQVTTVAGTRYSGADQSVDGRGAAARFSGLGGIVRVGTHLYVADTFNHTVRRVDLTTYDVTTLAGSAGAHGNQDGVGPEARFDTPQSLTGDAAFLYVTGWDGLLRRVAVADGRTTTLLGDADDVRPVDGVGAAVRLGIAFGPPLLDSARGLLYCNDRDANSLRRLDLDTLEMTTLAGAAQPSGVEDGPGARARFDSPSAIIAGDGAWFVADMYNHTVRAVAFEAGETRTLAGQPRTAGGEDGPVETATLGYPAGLAWHATTQHLYVADMGAHTVRAIDLRTRNVRTLAGATSEAGATDGEGAAARFSSPQHLALSPDGLTLYVADSGNGTVRAIATATGAVTTVAGTAGESGTVDGVGAAARFREPSGLALDAVAGRLYVSDASAQTLRAITLATGEVTTVAGKDRTTGVVDGTVAEALFKGPAGISLNAAGTRLYVADSGNHVIRAVDLEAGTVSTWLGNAVRSGGIGPGQRVSFRDATLYYPQAVAVGERDVALLSDHGVYLARPEVAP
ncbi:hypothetical protein [Corallococcus macrosporus]|uniref:Uncharacterized protein n=1 Tax=Corallococcus macrosporus DSM 14697 TaxID=1189310 RepID=A0A250JXD6_9BACT|nr:hypothetical protein [Corallococcus macrosporus]ATB48529.1 hypothetical protein MYMAC_004156 [Corallococcus macrosporus DSM 14697]